MPNILIGAGSSNMIRPMSRPKDQRARRQTLHEAALRVLTERGVAGTRLKDVAAEAGLTPATVLYYYPSLVDLQLEVLQQAMDRFYERRRQATVGIPDARERLITTIRAGLPTDANDQVARLAWETMSFELRNPVLAEFDRIYVERQIDLYASVLELGTAQGHFTLAGEARSIASNLLALEDYHGLRVLLGWLPTAADAMVLVAEYARTATGCDLYATAR
jgi:AcrR family transcriptional regulator